MTKHERQVLGTRTRLERRGVHLTDIFLIIVKWRKGGNSVHDYQKYIPNQICQAFQASYPKLTLVEEITQRKRKEES